MRPTADTFDRTAKILVDDGSAASLEGALATHGASELHLGIGADATQTGHQIAALTAVATGRRAFGRVTATIADEVADLPCTVRWFTGGTFAQALANAGATLTPAGGSQPTATLRLGDTNVQGIQVTWAGWRACTSDDANRLAEDDLMPLAPAAAAAMAVGRAFLPLTSATSLPYGDVEFSLWDTEQPPHGDGPALRHLPDGAWMIGLGHLGQAYAWCWALLPFADTSRITVVLQDDDIVKEANVSTGLLTEATTLNRLKTRVVEDRLDNLGFTTRLVERRFAEGQIVQPAEPRLAFIGVDNPDARRVVSTAGWDMAVDAGLGSLASNYTKIGLRTFPAAGASQDVRAWATTRRADPAEHLAQAPPYQDLLASSADRCGVVMLAGRAVAASFVGVLAACLAIAQPLRALHGQTIAAQLNLSTVRPDLSTGQPASHLVRFGHLAASVR